MDAVPRRTPDVSLFIAVVALLSLGIVMIYSASAIVALDRFGDSAFFLKRQLLWTLLGLGAMSVALTIHYERLRRATPVLLLLVAVALVAVLVPGVGRVAGGARRWITLGPLNFQPAEAAKLVLVLYLANYLTNRGVAVRRIATVWPPLLVTGGLFGLLVLQPDMGSAMMLGGLAGVMLFLGGASLWHLAGLGLAALPPLALVTVWEAYRVRRLLAFLDPWRDPRGSGFHIIQSLLALGSGGLLGLGLGASRQKFFYLPERHTDFIFAILGEELGLMGTGAVILLFAFVAVRGFRIARAAPDRYGTLLAGGITASIVGQAMLNIGVASGLLPITGVPLPFLSFGGSSLLTTCLGVGILLNISQYSVRRAVDAAPLLRPAREAR
jgi:cell division protein FtsW